MPNKFNNPQESKGGGPVNMASGKAASLVEKVRNWAGLPGKAQSKDRSFGAPKVKVHPVSKGL
jgi:hypothetical protein